MISLGNIPLISPTTELAGWIEANIPIDSAFAFTRFRFLSDSNIDPRNHLDWFLDRPLVCNQFFNPYGASRWGMAFVLVDENMLGKIRALAYAAPVKYNSLTLKIDDSAGSVVQTDLWLLPAIPLSKFDPMLNLYLLPLVEDRYFFWEIAATITVTENTTTWTQVYDQIATALGITLIRDPISADYLKPGAGVAKQYEYLPMLLDLVAQCVGQRIVRTLDGKFYARNATSGLALASAQVNSFTKTAGGQLTLPMDNAGNVPESVTVCFSRTDSGVLSASRWPVVTTLASLALSQYRGFGTPREGTMIVHDSAIAHFTGGGSPTNAAQLNTLAARIATDWYLWRLANLEMRYVRPVAWTADGLHDVTWNDCVSTMIHRSEWSPDFGALRTAGQYGSSDVPVSGGGSGSIVTSPTTGTATGPDYIFALTATGVDITISASGTTVTVNVPSASETARGVWTTGTQLLKGDKLLLGTFTVHDSTYLNTTEAFPAGVIVSSFLTGFVPYHNSSLAADGLGVDSAAYYQRSGLTFFSTLLPPLYLKFGPGFGDAGYGYLSLSGNNVINNDPADPANVMPAFAVQQYASAFFPVKIGKTGFTAEGDEISGGLVTGLSVKAPTGAAVVLNPSGQWLAQNATKLNLTGSGISTTFGNDTLALDSGTNTTDNTPPTATTMTVTLVTPPNIGPLKGTLTVTAVGVSAQVVVAIIVPAPTLDAAATAIATSTATLVVTGKYWNPVASLNTFTFTTLSAVADVISVTVDPITFVSTAILQFTTPPSGTGTLTGFMTSYGGVTTTENVAVVSTPSPGPSGPEVYFGVSPLLTSSTTMTVYGDFFDPTAGNDTIAFFADALGLVSTAIGTVSTATTNQLDITGLSGQTTGILYAIVTTNGVTSGAPVQVAVVAGAPTIIANTTKLASTAVGAYLDGSGFDLSAGGSLNAIVLSSGGPGISVTSSGASRLNFTFSSAPSTGSLTANVTPLGGVTSSTVQIWTVVDVTVTPDSTPLSPGSVSVAIVGTNFDPTPTLNFVTVTGDGGPKNPTAVNAAGTRMIYTFRTPPTASGTYTANVQAYFGLSGATTIFTITALWTDTFTDTNGTAITAHTPDVGSGGYTAVTGTQDIQSNQLHPAAYASGGSGSPTADAWFDPGTPMRALSVDFNLNHASFAFLIGFRYDSATQGGIWLRIDDGGQWWIIQGVFGGGAAAIATGTMVPSIGTMYTITATDDGSNISATVNGVNINAVSTYQAANSKCVIQFVDVGVSGDLTSYADNLIVT